MKTIEESVVISMDGSDTKLLPFLPYILQDLWEIGTNPDVVIRLVRKQFKKFEDLKILDLGCGKGAVSVKLAQKLGCTCHGIDAIPEFIEFAREKATQYKVNHLCTFETGDIREKVKDLRCYDVIILGSIGPIFGDYFSTLITLKKCLKDNGIIIIDDAYISDDSNFTHPSVLKKTELFHQIEKAGMQFVDNEILDNNNQKETDEIIFYNLKKRCIELITKFPDQQNLFLDYIKQQEQENEVLEKKVILTTMTIKKRQM